MSSIIACELALPCSVQSAGCLVCMQRLIAHESHTASALKFCVMNIALSTCRSQLSVTVTAHSHDRDGQDIISHTWRLTDSIPYI